MVDRKNSPEEPTLGPKSELQKQSQPSRPVIRAADMASMSAAHQADPKGLTADELVAAVKMTAIEGALHTDIKASRPNSQQVADILAALGNGPVGRSLESNDTVVSLQPRTEWDLSNFESQGVIDIRLGDGYLDQVKLDPDREGAIAYSNPNMAAALAIANKMADMKMAEPVRFTVITTPGVEVKATEVFSKDQRVQWFAAISSMNGDVGRMEPWTALEGVYPDPMILDARIRREILAREVGSALAGMTPEFLHAHKNRTMEEVDLAALPIKEANALSNQFFNLTDLGEAMVKGNAKIHVPEHEIGEVKTYQGWGESRVSLDKFLKVGDRVDQEMADYFINVMPPATLTSSLIQVGEPSSHVGGRPTFATLNRTGEGWVYAGDCFKGERISPKVERG